MQNFNMRPCKEIRSLSADVAMCCAKNAVQSNLAEPQLSAHGALALVFRPCHGFLSADRLNASGWSSVQAKCICVAGRRERE